MRLHADHDPVTLNFPAENLVGNLYPVAGFQPGRVGQAFVIVENTDDNFRRLNIGMTIFERNNRHQLVICDTGYHDTGMFSATHADGQLQLIECPLTIGIT